MLADRVTLGLIVSEHLLPQSIAWSLCGGAVGMALDKLQEDFHFADFDLRLMIGYSECDLTKTLGLGIEYMLRQKADVVIGPPCPEAAIMMAHLSNIYQTAWMGWGYVFSPEFTLSNKYPYGTTLVPSSNS
ncbi:unnamed protein product [Strongylus vulgaris]|uniref:Receptor ligand binding region domain-containing protein n=1 Tax=Strongylus vulgaris TaxID=40348 RepID=A0A3P7JK09_STRVU|nr:unnamed protein product [Strongylus vulgaris]